MNIVTIKDLLEGFQQDSVQMYFRKKCELAEAFGADHTTAELDMKEVVEFEMAIAEVIEYIRLTTHYSMTNKRALV